jgi:hypothetical protein
MPKHSRRKKPTALGAGLDLFANTRSSAGAATAVAVSVLPKSGFVPNTVLLDVRSTVARHAENGYRLLGTLGCADAA